MADPIQTLSDIEIALENLAKPDLSKKPHSAADPVQITIQNVTFVPLDKTSDLLRLLYLSSADAKALGKAIADGLGKAADALETVADAVKSVLRTGGDVDAWIQAIQNALAAARTLVPGTSVLDALDSGKAFFSMLSGLLNSDAVKLGKQADEILLKLAQQWRAVANAIATGTA